MEIICAEEHCTGCAACMNACPKDAISMQPRGAFQHIYPTINPEVCIDCGLCAKICPVNTPISLTTPLRAFAAISRDDNDLMSSSSGGAASVMSAYILKQGGVVYGCVQKNYRDIAHRRIDSAADAAKLKGSKYVQSNINLVYREVKADLRMGTPVLFTGTPCQIAGLRAYLRKDYDNLYLVDLVCHGVPSQYLLWENVESMLGQKSLRNLPYVDFRKKNEPLDRMFGIFLRNTPKMSKKKQLFLYNDYITAFMTGLTYRPNCYACAYAQPNRGSDITISDFWGIGHTSVPTDKGISLLLQNTEKGGTLIANCLPAFHWEERSVEEAIQGNGQLIQPTTKPENRDTFELDYASFGTKAYRKHLREYRFRWRLEHNLLTPQHYLYIALNKLKSTAKKIPGARILYQYLKSKIK